MKQVYATEQRRRLLEFLRAHPGSQYTIRELSDAMAGLPDAPAVSTVYRLMKELVEAGVVRRFVKGNSRQFLYHLVEGEHCDSHLHLKCLSCGKLIHMDDDVSDLFLDKIRDLNHFELDEKRTLLFGRCDTCVPPEK